MFWVLIDLVILHVCIKKIVERILFCVISLREVERVTLGPIEICNLISLFVFYWVLGHFHLAGQRGFLLPLYRFHSHSYNDISQHFCRHFYLPAIVHSYDGCTPIFVFRSFSFGMS